MCKPDGGFTGGSCVASACKDSVLAHSSTTCAGYTGDSCTFRCLAGFEAAGARVCNASGAFTGGACEGVKCFNGLRLQHSNTTCDGGSGDVCAYNCDAGYSAAGTHRCKINGWFDGGSCARNRCADSAIAFATSGGAASPCRGPSKHAKEKGVSNITREYPASLL